MIERINAKGVLFKEGLIRLCSYPFNYEPIYSIQIY